MCIRDRLVRDKVEVEFSKIFKTVGLGTTIWSPLASGVLTGKYNKGKAKNTRFDIEGLDWLKDKMLVKENLKRVEKLGKIANDLGLSMPVMAVAWCLKNPNVSTVMLGASKKAQLKENLKAVEAKEKLTPDVLEAIEKVLKNKPAHPAF